MTEKLCAVIMSEDSLKYAYNVRCCHKDAAVAERWVNWLLGGHIDDIKQLGGAETATLVRLSSEESADEKIYEVRYVFPSKEAFDK